MRERRLKAPVHSSYNSGRANMVRRCRWRADWKGAESVQLQLDTQDIHLLTALAALGDASPQMFDQHRRLERLELEGYVSSVRQDPPRLDAAPTWVYRLTLNGRAVATRR